MDLQKNPIVPRAAALVAGVALLAAVATAADGDRPAAPAALPASLHGFNGYFSGKLLSKDIEKGTLVMLVDKVMHVWKANQASEPRAAEGRTLTVTGIHSRAIDVLIGIEPGDHLEVGAKHVQGDHLVHLEGIRKVAAAEEKPGGNGQEAMAGFRGVLVGKVLGKDVEKGTVEIEVESVKTVFKKSTAPRPESAVGQTWRIRGIAGKFLDALLVIDAGERIELAAFHNGGEVLDFPGELLRKAE